MFAQESDGIWLSNVLQTINPPDEPNFIVAAAELCKKADFQEEGWRSARDFICK